VDKSLVNFELTESGEGRYRMLEMVPVWVKRLEERERPMPCGHDTATGFWRWQRRHCHSCRARIRRCGWSV